MFFNDKLSINKETKKVISIRDGIQKYLGIEIGKEPSDKVFSIYRSPATIQKVVNLLNGIPVTNEHIELQDNIPNELKIGKIDDSKLINKEDNTDNSTIAIENDITLDKNMIQLLDEKNQLSLGYFAELVESNEYDFEQTNIIPHHLAIVKNGRCGDTCKFLDKGEEKVEEENKDVTNTDTPETTQEQSTPEEKTPPTNGANQKMQGLIQNVISEIGLDKFMSLLETAVKNNENQDEDTNEEDTKKSDSNDTTEEDKTPKDNSKDFTDSQEFKDAVMKMGNERANIILKAKKFLDEKYTFEDKDNLSIMKDVLKREVKEEFKDDEVGIAFRMLKKMKNYSNFADKNINKFDELKDKEL